MGSDSGWVLAAYARDAVRMDAEGCGQMKMRTRIARPPAWLLPLMLLAAAAVGGWLLQVFAGAWATFPAVGIAVSLVACVWLAVWGAESL